MEAISENVQVDSSKILREYDVRRDNHVPCSLDLTKEAAIIKLLSGKGRSAVRAMATHRCRQFIMAVGIIPWIH